MVLTRSRANSATRAAQQPVDVYATASEQVDGAMPSTFDGGAFFVDVRSSTPPLAGPPSAGDSAPSPLPLHGRELPVYSQMSQHGHAPPVTSPQPPMTTPIVMTDQQLVFLMQSLRSQPPTQGAPPPPTTFVSTTNLSNCTSRFNGAGDVLSFLDAIQIYKDCVGVHDDMALRGLPMLLTDFAATWWQGVKHSVASWRDAVHLMRQTFGPRLPPHRIYREMFSREQGEERTDMFVCRLRALIAQLPLHTLPENPVQLDMVYGLLHRRIRERIVRSSFTSFAELLQQSRAVEDILEEVCAAVPARRHASSAAAAPPPLQVTSLTTMSSLAGCSVNKDEKAPLNKVRPRCTYCKLLGHVKEDCRKLEYKSKVTPEPVKSEPAATQPELRQSVTCFGCGAPGVIRSNCAACKANRTALPTMTAFQSVSVSEGVLNPRVRPIFHLQVFGAVGTAVLDTGAKQCIASESLTKHLRANGQLFKKVETELRFADGTQRVQIVETAVVLVKMQGVEISTLFVVLPGATDSLLGMNFIEDAGMVLDFEKGRFSLRDTEFFDLQYERGDRAVVSSTLNLGENEGNMLSSAEKSKLAARLDSNPDIFSAGGGLTPFALHRIKPTNLKPAGLLQTPVPQQRFEVLAMDLFGPLPEGSKGEKWIFLIEDTASRWVELFPLAEANAENCAKVLIEEVFMRYGFPRRVISDNGTQFVSAVMQKAMLVLGVHQNLCPVYHPEANPAERKNRDMKQMLAMLIDPEHRHWPDVLPAVRFALNTAPNQGTGHSAAFLTFAREFRSPVDVAHDLRTVVAQENYVPQITPYLRNFVHHLQEVKWRVGHQQDIRKDAADKSRRPAPNYREGDLVLVDSHRLSQAANAPRREGPYRIRKVVSATTYEVEDKESEPRGKYHASLLTPYVGESDTVVHGRKKGRPRKASVAKPAPEPLADLEGEDIVPHIVPIPHATPCRLRRLPARLRD